MISRLNSWIFTCKWFSAFGEPKVQVHSQRKLDILDLFNVDSKDYENSPFKSKLIFLAQVKYKNRWRKEKLDHHFDPERFKIAYPKSIIALVHTYS